MNRNKVLNVHIDGCLVGTMAETADRRYAFAYDKQWIKNGYPIRSQYAGGFVANLD